MSDRKTRIEQLHQAIQQRILVLDGAMGTMIQRLDFDENEYRGKRFKDHHSEVKGNNDLLCLSQPVVLLK